MLLLEVLGVQEVALLDPGGVFLLKLVQRLMGFIA